MTDDRSMQETAKDLAGEYAPWKKDVPWTAVLVEGIVALGLGLYMLFADVAAGIVVNLLGLLLLVFGLVDAFNGFRGKVKPNLAPLHMLGAGVAIGIGGVVALDLWRDFMGLAGSVDVVVFGLILYGLVALVVWIRGGESGDRTLGELVVPVGSLFLGLGAWLAGPELRRDIFQWVSIGIAVIGGLLLLWAFMLRNRQEAAAEMPSPAVDQEVAKAVEQASEDVKDAMVDAAEDIESAAKSD